MSVIGRFCIICFVFFTASCSEEQIRKVGLHGSLSGKVNAYNPFVGGSALQDVEVVIEGTDPLITLHTDSNGKFEVPDLETGTYHLTFKKVGYGTHKILGYSFVGGDFPMALPPITLYSLPNMLIKNVEVTVTRYGSVAYASITVFIDNPQSVTSGYFRYYLSKEPGVSSSQYQETGILGSYYNQSSSYSLHTNFDVKRFPAGTSIYMIVHPCTEQYSNYLDIETGKKIYSSIGESNTGVLTIQIPN